LPSLASATTMPHWHAEYTKLPERTQAKSAGRRLLKPVVLMTRIGLRQPKSSRTLAVMRVVAAVCSHLAWIHAPVVENCSQDGNTVLGEFPVSVPQFGAASCVGANHHHRSVRYSA